MKTRTVYGLRFDADREEALSWRDKSFCPYFQEFKPDQLRPFIDYLMSGTLLDWEWNSRDGYNDLSYENANGEEKSITGNHGLTGIIKSIEEGRWNPSDVLHEFVLFYRACNFCDETSREERQELFQEVKALIQRGFYVEVVDHSDPLEAEG
jgi:hypothetical protein